MGIVSTWRFTSVSAWSAQAAAGPQQPLQTALGLELPALPASQVDQLHMPAVLGGTQQPAVAGGVRAAGERRSSKGHAPNVRVRRFINVSQPSVQLSGMPPAVHSPENQLRLFGSAHLMVGGEAVPLPHQAPTAVLAVLGAHGDWMPRERLMALFWPDVAEADALRSLRVTLHRSRQWLARWHLDDALQTHASAVRVDLPCDVSLFRRAVAVADIAQVLALHSAPLLLDWRSKPYPVLEAWIEAEREALRTTWRDLVWRAATQRTSTEPEQALAWMLALVDEDAQAEDVLQALMRLAVGAPDGHPSKAAALARYRRFVARARREGDDPAGDVTMKLADTLSGQSGGRGEQAPGPTRADTPRSSVAPGLAMLEDVPWVGRDDELQRLRQCTADLVVVTGTPGIGKSRLLSEWLPEHTGRTMWWRCRPGLQSVPMLCVAQALQRHEALLRSMALSSGVQRELARLVPALGTDELTAPAEDAALLTTLSRVLPRMVDTLVIDDLQWVDSATLQLLRLLTSDQPLRLVAAMRTNVQATDVRAWLDDEEAAGRVFRLALTAWSLSDAHQLVHGLSGHAAPKFATWLHGRSGGNPLFAVETLRALAQRGLLRQDAQGWATDLDDIGGDYEALPVPDRVVALVHQRVSRLSLSGQQLLQAAAVVGEASPLGPIADIAQLNDLSAAQCMTELQQAGLLRGEQFAHDVLRESVLVHLAPPLVRHLHAQVVDVMDEHLPPHRLAEHAWHARDESRAVALTLRASALDRELGLMHSALSMLSTARTRTANPMLLASIDAERAENADNLGLVDDSESYARAALEGPASPAARASALSTLAVAHMHRGDLKAAWSVVQQLLSAHPDWPDRYTVPAKLAHADGDYEQALALMQQHVAWVRTLNKPGELASALSGVATSLAALGRVDEAEPLHREAVEMAQAAKARFIEVYATANWLHSHPRQDDAAIELGERALALGDYVDSHRLRLQLASRCMVRHRWQDALRHVSPACESDRPLIRAVAWARRITVCAALQRDVERREAIERAFESAGQTEEYRAHAIVAACVLHDGDAKDISRATALLKPARLDPQLMEQLATGLARHGLAYPKAAVSINPEAGASG